MARRPLHFTYTPPLPPDFVSDGLVCIALGIANIFHASLLIIFSIICLYMILPHPKFSATPQADLFLLLELQELFSSLLKFRCFCVFAPPQRSSMASYDDSTKIGLVLACTLGTFHHITSSSRSNALVSPPYNSAVLFLGPRL